MELAPQHIEPVVENTRFSRQVSIWLDSYEDIFSDFDPRSFSERILSDDFISELKRLSREDEFGVGELRLLIPEKSRNEELEKTITKRLHTYFKRSNYFIFQRIKKSKEKGLLFAAGGIIMMLLASYISGIHSDSFWVKLLFVLFEPAGWFFVWTGMDNLFFSARQRSADLEFYTKLAKTKVIFASF